ncbi:hypothetical protein CCMSSC00406_0001620 [Pleurotus cornucopiae]|uniref:Uncharacterized protein n=1 Tax=Pleurotus cornucopiae TaxID=5321 RepID=A0ACB7IND2_PLECO|nr:hypothetical protein CCMSSC00406_0001620 [Pleurotus cornucopiae]
MAKGEDFNPMTHHSKKKRTEDGQPQSPDIGQKPIQLQRRRVWRACESCRRKKIKCDGCEPTCSQCASTGSQCTWLQTKDRAALSRHYVQELEARLLHMESLFTQIAPVLEQIGPMASGSNSTDAAAGSSTGPGTASKDNANPKALAVNLRNLINNKEHKRSGSSEPGTPVKAEDEVSESFGQLALDEHGHFRWIGGSSTMSLIQSFRALTSSPLHRVSPMEEDPRAPGPSVNKLYFPAQVFFGKVRALPGPEEVEYPEPDLADKLIEAYFARFHFLMPVIDKPSFLRQYRTLMENKHDATHVRSEAAFVALVFAVYACAAHLVDDKRLTLGRSMDEGGMGMVYYERALILQYISHAHTQVAHVQCFLLMSSFLCSVNCLPQAWILVGQAVRIGQDLGLHRSPRRLVITPIEKETRRRIWWGVYTLDRMLALALGRPLGVNDSDCDVEMPVEVDDDHLSEYFTGAPMTQRQPSLMAGFTYLISLYEIAGRVLREVYALENCKEHLEPEQKANLQKLVESLDNELTKWCDELPAVFKSQSETDEQVSMGAVLCSHYYSVLTTLHRNFLPVKRDQPVTPKSTVKAVSSARSCIRLAPSMRDVVPPSHHLAFFIQHLFSSAVILLLYAMHATDPRAATAAMEEARTTLTAMEQWEGQWPGARKCKELLIELANTASEAIANGPRDINEGPSQTTSPTLVERRRSVTISTSAIQASGSRPVKGRPNRRTQSRDASSARRAAVSPYRVDSAQRARSTSRKRGIDEAEPVERASLASYYQTFSSPTLNPARTNTNISPHSSPSSVNLPSPSMTVERSQEASPRLPNAQTYATAVSPVQVTSPSTSFNYDFNMHPAPLTQMQSQPWPSTSDNRGPDLFPPSTHDANMSYNGFNTYPSPYDSSFLNYEPSTDMGNLGTLSTTPPSASFAAPGLPFSGLEYIRNYRSNGYSLSGEQDSLWHSYDPGAFGLDPDLPFTPFGDLNNDTPNQEGHR